MQTKPTLLPGVLLVLLTLAATCGVVAPGATAPPQAGAVPPDASAPDSTGPTDNTVAKTVVAAEPDKDGRILLSNFPVASGAQSSTGSIAVTLDQPKRVLRFKAYKADPTLRDEVKILLTPEVVTQLKHLGIKDAAAHFKGKTLQVRGTRTMVDYRCLPAIRVYTVTVDRLQDLLIINAPG